MTTNFRKPIKISLHYHSAKKIWYWRYIFAASEKVEKDGKFIYRYKKGDKQEIYINDINWHKDPKNGLERQQNKDTEKMLREELESRRVENRRGMFNVQSKDVKNRNVLDDLKEYAYSSDNKYKQKTITQHMSIHKHLRTFTGFDSISYDDITEEFFIEYLSYLKSDGIARMGKNLADSSVENYFNKFRDFIKRMKRKGYLMEFPAEDVKVKKSKNKRKESLSSEEIQSIIKTPCASPILKRWFLFSCFSGQAHAECREMEWQDIYEAEGITRIRGTRLKSNSDYVVPLNEQAKHYLGEQGNKKPTDKVFDKLIYHGNNNRYILDWMKAAGIIKHITPHCARHTFTRNYWEHGDKDIIALMQILDHKDVTTTQRYLAGVIGSQYDTAVPTVGSYDLE